MAEQVNHLPGGQDNEWYPLDALQLVRLGLFQMNWRIRRNSIIMMSHPIIQTSMLENSIFSAQETSRIVNSSPVMRALFSSGC